MVKILQASQLSLAEVENKLGLEEITERSFFPEWQGQFPGLSEYEQLTLDRSREDFLSLLKYKNHEEIVKLTVLAPLLSLAGLLRFPFYPQAEEGVQIAVEDDGEAVHGRIDVRILYKQLWAVTIESKNKQFSAHVALPQAILYMMDPAIAAPDPRYGFVTNGTHFQFIKLVRQGRPQYGLSHEFSLANNSLEFYSVLQILKRLCPTAAVAVA